MKSTNGGETVLSLSRFFNEVCGVASTVGAFFCIVCGAIGAWVSHLYGGWNASLTVLFWLVFGDYVTGMVASIMDGTGLSSKVGSRGIPKKVAILFLVFVARELDVAMQVHFIMNMTIYFYVTNELISLLENLARMGVPVPRQMVSIIQILKGQEQITKRR